MSGKGTDDGAADAAARTRRSVPAGPSALLLAVALLAALTAAVAWGSTSIPPGEVWSVVWHRLTGHAPRPGTNDLIVWQLRLPRALLAALVGAGLGLVGTTMQALVRNPLADPYFLGVSNGASLGAVAAIVLGLGTGGALGLGLSAAAFAGALATFALVWAVARRGGGFAPLRLVLAGVAIGQFLSGFTS
ncbi:iron chelate uptake ABC transporter family permease subunit, partial [Streptomyces albiflaviniger]|nr:iron chelate uptake ABC transporter family permease subunit [Streptomyces albiflaviniger]